MRREYILEGSRILSLETFYDEVSDVLIPGVIWGRNLDAFNDILRGGFGTPEGFVLRWKDAASSKSFLGAAFETLVDIIRDHGFNGDQADDAVTLVLE